MLADRLVHGPWLLLLGPGLLSLAVLLLFRMALASAGALVIWILGGVLYFQSAEH